MLKDSLLLVVETGSCQRKCLRMQISSRTVAIIINSSTVVRQFPFFTVEDKVASYIDEVPFCVNPNSACDKVEQKRITSIYFI